VGTVTNYAYSTDDGATFRVFEPAQTFSPVNISKLSVDDSTLLTNETVYTVKLKAINVDITSEESMSVEVTPTVTSLYEGNRLIRLEASDPASYSGSGTTWTNLDSGGSYSAELLNSPTFHGENGFHWVTFNGTNQVANIAQSSAININSAPPFGSFTAQIWAKVNTSSSSFAPGDGVISKQHGVENFMDYDGYSLSLGTSSVVFNTNGGTFTINASSPSNVYNNGWALYTIVVRFGGGSVNPSYAYVSSRRVVTVNNTETGMPRTPAPLQFPRGIQNSNANFCPADVGAFYFYNTALSQETIIQNFDATKHAYLN
jgi:hypothetical protein